MNKISIYISLTTLSFLAFACDKDEFTGDSKLTPTNPTVAIGLPEPANFIEKDSTFEVTITINTPQVVDIIIPLTIVDGDATEGDDFTIDHEVFIPAHRTSAKATIKVLADEIVEETETFTVQVGGERTANAQIASQTVVFTIMNVTEGDLPLHFSWDLEYFDATGTVVSPDDVADMILYITDQNGNVLEEVDGATFEDFVIPSSWTDGEYLVKAGVYAVINPGQLGGPPVLDLNLDYAQVGKLNATTFSFPGAFTGILCDWNIFTMASIVKSGTDYTVTSIGAFDFNLSEFTGAYSANEPGYGDYDVNFTIDDCNTIINDNFWDGGLEVAYVLDPEAGTANIPLQVLDASAFGLGNITVEGSGTYDSETFSMVVDYVVKKQSDGSILDDNTHTFTK